MLRMTAAGGGRPSQLQAHDQGLTALPQAPMQRHLRYCRCCYRYCWYCEQLRRRLGTRPPAPGSGRDSSRRRLPLTPRQLRVALTSATLMQPQNETQTERACRESPLQRQLLHQPETSRQMHRAVQPMWSQRHRVAEAMATLQVPGT